MTPQKNTMKTIIKTTVFLLSAVVFVFLFGGCKATDGNLVQPVTHDYWYDYQDGIPDPTLIRPAGPRPPHPPGPKPPHPVGFHGGPGGHFGGGRR